MDINDYLEKHHGLEAVLSTAVTKTLLTRPDAPLQFLADTLQEAATAEDRRKEAAEIAALDDFRELKELEGGCNIELTEHRAISLDQLEVVTAQIGRRCVSEGWTGDFFPPQVPTKETRRLTPAMVRLYDADKYVIRPATVARQCSFVEMVACKPQRPDYFVSHWCAGVAR